MCPKGGLNMKFACHLHLILFHAVGYLAHNDRTIMERAVRFKVRKRKTERHFRILILPKKK